MANMDMGGGGDPPKIVAGEICVLVNGEEVSLDDYVEGLVSGSDPDVKAALVACLAGLIVSPDPNVLKAAINACIAAGLVPAEGGAVGGIIWQAIKACLSAPPVILETVGANPNVNAQTAAAGQPPGTLIIFPGDGTPQDPDWVWYVNADGTVTNIESPPCCPNPPVVIEADTEAAAIAAAAGQPAGTLINFIGNGTATNPDSVWYVNADGTVTNIESPAGAADPPVLVTSTGDDEAGTQTDAAAALAGKKPLTIAKVTDANGCQWIYRLEPDGTTCLIHRPHRQMCARAASNVGINITIDTPTGVINSGLTMNITLKKRTSVMLFGSIDYRYFNTDNNCDLRSPCIGAQFGEGFEIDGATLSYAQTATAIDSKYHGEEQRQSISRCVTLDAGTHSIEGFISYTGANNMVDTDRVNINQFIMNALWCEEA